MLKYILFRYKVHRKRLGKANNTTLPSPIPLLSDDTTDTGRTEAPPDDPTSPDACPLGRRGPNEGETSVYYEVSAILPGKQFSDALWDFDSIPYQAMSNPLREKVGRM